MSASADDAAQSGSAYRVDWGLDGLDAIAPNCDVIVECSAQLDASDRAAQLVDAAFVGV